ncbi:MAG: hypothetical protein LBI54_06075 [Lachnospiraceae bacterium]|jgi:hypothetical protein|nr:hypothetical protein [Lachnospiraceae bacterium]
MYILSKNGLSVVNTELMNLVATKTSNGAVLKAVGAGGDVVLETYNSENDAQQVLLDIFEKLELGNVHTYRMFNPKDNSDQSYIDGGMVEFG